MNYAKKVLAAGCLFAMLSTPLVSFAAPVQTSPRNDGPVVTVTASTYSKVAISRVNNYVNVRTEANTHSEIVGKIYNNCAATILATVDGEGGKWYQIQSGTVTGYIKAEYFITGAEAEKIAKEIGTVFVQINTTTLRLREQASTDSKTLTLLSQDAEYIEVGEEGDFVKIEVDASLSGYVHKDYIKERVEFDSAVSLLEEQQQKEEAERVKKEADEAIATMNQLLAASGSGQTVENNAPAESEAPAVTAPAGTDGSTDTSATVDTTAPAANGNNTASSAPAAPVQVGMIAANPNSANQPDVTTVAPVTGKTQTETETSSAVGPAAANGAGSQAGPEASDTQATAPAGVGSAELASATRTAIVAYAKQYLGNPYVFGGTSLTNGTDCSGFTMRIYEHFGISTGRSSRDQAANGKTISINDVQPGDLVFYASGDYINHVALYIGGGQIIHASNSRTGIITSTMYYRTPYKAVTFLN